MLPRDICNASRIARAQRYDLSRMKRLTWWQGATIVVALFAAGLPPATRLLAGPPGAIVHVRWHSETNETSRKDLEGRFHLNDGQRLDAETWRYDLLDPSNENIRALVADPAVQDTHHIDRPASSLVPSAARTERRLRFTYGDRAVATADLLSRLLIALVLLLVGLGISGRASTARDARQFVGGLLAVCWNAAREAATFVLQLLSRGIPDLDAGTAGLFRIAFGSAAVLYFATRPVDASWLADTFDLELENRPSAAVLDWLRAHPTVVDRIAPWLLVTGGAFTAGILTRLSYPLFVGGALLWGYVITSISTTSIHPSGPFLVGLIALLPSRWADAYSVDAWLRRTRGRASAALPPGRHYGYSVWVPVLALGVGLAAAAWAKLTVPPHWTDWILNGTVKYHFVRDVAKAPVDWGLQLAGHPWLAVFASFGVIFLESLVLTAAFVRNQWYRLAVGVAALPLAGGFYLFMGVFWPAWWILLLAFLPWPWLASRRADSATLSPRAAPGARTRWLAAGQLALIVLVIAQQVVSSALKVERVPIFSWYDMYSGTYESPEVWNATRTPTYRLVLSTTEGRKELPACDPYPAFVRTFETALAGSVEARTRIWQALRPCVEHLSAVRDVTLEGDVRVFDWERLTFTILPSAARLGPLHASNDVVPTSAR